MQTHIIEAIGLMNWGKFLLGRHDEEWARTSHLHHVSDEQESLRPLLFSVGWEPDALWVLDLQTGEGALFRPGGHARYDLAKHRVWVCPLFEPFLEWLYTQDLTDLTALPTAIRLDDAPAAFYGYRRQGPDLAEEPS